MLRVSLVLLSFILVEEVVVAWDGCGPGRMRCGDLCTYRKNQCTCGNKTLKLEQFRDYQTWCCLLESANCTDIEGNITCQGGKYQALTEPGSGRCNYFPDDPNNAFRSYKPCDSSINITINWDVHCVWESKFGNYEYDCIDRTNEKPYRKKEKEGMEISLFSHSSTCEHPYGPGLNCSGYLPTKCLSYAGWCQPDQPFECPSELGSLLSQDPELCGNSSFWAGLPCTSALGKGRRCKGKNSGQCVYPLSSYDFVTSRSCQDKSDRIHSFNTTCPSYSEKDHPHCSKDLRKFCGFTEYGRVVKYAEYTKYWESCLLCFDPTNCISSCAKPSPSPTNYTKDVHQHCRLPCEDTDGIYAEHNKKLCEECISQAAPMCQACNSPDLYMCDNSRQCVHPELRCDLHPQCSLGEDEIGCFSQYKKKKLVPEDALYECQSPHHNDDLKPVVLILAVRCDGRVECYKRLDEEGCQEGTDLVSQILSFLQTVLTLLLSAVITFVLRKGLIKTFKEHKKQENIELRKCSEDLIPEIQQLRNNQQWEEFIETKKENHNTAEHNEQLSLAILRMSSMEEKESVKISSTIYSIELMIHGSKAAAHCCLKEAIESELFKALHGFLYPGFVDKMLPEAIKNRIKKKMEQFTSTKVGRICKICFKLVLFYGDPVKDFTFWYTLVGLVGFSVLFNPEFLPYFQIQVIWILGLALFLPLFVSAVQITKNCPLAIFCHLIEKKKENLPKWQIFLVQCFVILLFPLMPAMLILAIEEEEEKLIQYAKELNEDVTQQEKAHILRKINDVNAFIKNTKRMVLTIKTNEVLENMCNLFLQTLMLALHETTTSTTRGLEAVFTAEKRVSTELLLMLSVLWSLRTSVTTRIKAKKAALGGFLSGVGSALFGFRALLMTAVKMGCFIVFFAPYMGLFNILQHWRSEQIQLANNKGYLMDTYPKLFRADPGSEHYMGKLKDGYMIFLGLLVLHLFLIFCIQITMSQRFSKSSRWSMLQQVLNIFSLPDSNKDWSEGPGDISEHSDRRKWHLMEAVLVGTLQWLMHMVMFVPLWISAKNIEERHQILLETIGVFPEESQACGSIHFWKWLLPIFVTLSWIVDMSLIAIFHFFLHPWVDILKDDKQGDMRRILERTKELIDESMTNDEVKNFLKKNSEFAKNLLDLLNDSKTDNLILSIVSMPNEEKENLLAVLPTLLRNPESINLILSIMAKPDNERIDLVEALTKETKNDKTVLKIENENFNDKEKANDTDA